MSPAPSPSSELSSDLIPLDWNFYSTDSSIVFKLEPTALQPYWVEAHAHLGRFNTLPLSITLTSHQKGLDEGTTLLERIFKELLQRRLPAFFGRSGPPAGLELQPSIYYFGIRLNLEPLSFNDPLIKHLPRRARAQVEKVLSVIPADELGSIVETVPTLDSELTLTSPAVAGIASPDAAGIIPPLEAAIALDDSQASATAPRRQTIEQTAAPNPAPAPKRPAKTRGNSAPSPGFTQAHPRVNVIQPNRVGISTAQPASAANINEASVAATAGASAWDWDEEDDDIVF
jgi:hypothetical protein